VCNELKILIVLISFYTYLSFLGLLCVTGAEKVFIHVHKENHAAQYLYQQMGFKVHSYRPFFT
jgi:ribosomal protein S18 acetylase RimI-like enzyme